MNFLQGMEPDFYIRKELRFVGGVLDLRQFDRIFIAVSGGKDSHAMLFLVKELAEKQGCTDKLVAMYADTGMEWHNAEAHVRKICAVAGVHLEILYPYRPMFEQIKFRISQVQKSCNKTKVAFPTSACRYCTSEQKLSPMNIFIRKHTGKLLKVTGKRWQESRVRSSYTEFVRADRVNSRSRQVYGWRPMLAFSTDDIFSMVKDSGVERHMAYDAGCDRLGCAGCIFSNDRELKIEMENNPHILAGLDELERKSGFTMSMDGRTVMERIKKA